MLRYKDEDQKLFRTQGLNLYGLYFLNSNVYSVEHF